MARITIDDCLKQVENRFDLTLAAAQRTRMLKNGFSPEIELSHEQDKFTVIALREIAEGKVGGAEMLSRIQSND